MSDKPAAPERSHRTQIVVAVIGIVGTLGTALIANWDKVFGPGSGASAPKAPAAGTQGAQSPVVTGVTGNVTIQIGAEGGAAAADVGGRWVSDELPNPYDAQWRYVLSFDLRVQGDAVVGSVTQRVTQPHAHESTLALLAGKVDGPTLSFQTRSDVMLGSETRSMTTYYVGTLRDGQMHFTRHNDSPGGGAVETFVARRP